MKLNLLKIFILIFLMQPVTFKAQQLPDTSYTFSIRQTAYQQGEGSVIFIDEAHNNFHTKDGGFFAFSKLLGQDGYQVLSLNKSITQIEILKDCKILVIVNALDSINVDDWFLPNPSAFTDKEIGIIKQWVENGGNLFLIADHMPFAGAACKLGKAFGFEFINGFARTGERSWPPSTFSLKNNTLKESPITTGINDYELVTEVSTFTGSAFKTPDNAIPVLKFLDEHYSLQPDTAWVFDEHTPSQYLGGYYQGAVMKSGLGKVAVFGEAAMFTAQIANETVKAGINSECATQNAQFTLNLIHWLDGVKEYNGTISKD